MKYYYLKRHKGIFKYYLDRQIHYGYRFRYYDESHRRHEKSKRGFDTLNQAIVAYTRLKRRQSGDKATMTVKSWCRYYLHLIQPPIRKVSTYKSYEHLLEDNIIPYVGDYRIDELRLGVYQDRCINALFRKGLSRRTVIASNAKLQTIMNYAVKDGYLTANPIKSVTISKVNLKPKKVVMDKGQLKMFNDNLDRHSLQCKTIYYALEKTGMRLGELLGLRWCDVDLKKRILNIRRTRDEYGVRKPKTISSKRKLIIPESLCRLLERYKENCSKKIKLDDRMLIVRGKSGKPLMPNLVSIELKRLLTEAGLSSLIGRFTPHSFRHQFASNLILDGVNPLTISKFLGHSNPSITMKIYTQLAPNVIPDISKHIK